MTKSQNIHKNKRVFCVKFLKPRYGNVNTKSVMTFFFLWLCCRLILCKWPDCIAEFIDAVKTNINAMKTCIVFTSFLFFFFFKWLFVYFCKLAQEHAKRFKSSIPTYFLSFLICPYQTFSHSPKLIHIRTTFRVHDLTYGSVKTVKN